MPISATHAGECMNCEEGIRIGQRIERIDRGGVGAAWAHVACPMPRPICGVCFTQKSINGSCLCGVAA